VNLIKIVMDFSQGTYASADFSESDAGAGGGVTAQELNSIVNIKTAINNLVDSTSNVIESTIDGYKMKLGEQRRNLKVLCCLENLNVLNSFVRPEAEKETIDVLKNLAYNLNNPSFNPSSRDFFKDLNIDLSGNLQTNTLTEELGIPYEEAHNLIMKINTLYNKTVTELFVSDKRLQSSIKNAENILKQVENILTLEENEISSELYATLSKYVNNSFAKLEIADAFTNFIETRRKFVHYKNLLGLKNAASISDEPPTCSICMEKSINTVFINCGHTFCNNCAQKQVVNCYICRCRISQKLRLYFS